MESKRLNNGAWGAGVALILLGLVFLAATQGTLGLDWGNMWPAFLVIPGLLALASAFGVGPDRREGPVMGGLVLLGLGTFFFATTLDWTSWNDQGTLWPLYLVIPGLAACGAYLAGRLERPGYLVLGGVLTVIGAGLLAATLSGWLYDARFWSQFNADWDRLSFFRQMDTWWPLVPIVVGSAVLAVALTVRDANRCAALAVLGTIPFLVGLFFLATTTGLLSWDAQGRLWPLYPLIVGAGLLTGWLVSGRTATGFLVPGVIVASVGLVFLALMTPGYDRIGEWWPVFVILAGVLLLFLPRLRGTSPPGSTKGLRR